MAQNWRQRSCQKWKSWQNWCDAHVTLISVSSEATDVAGMASPEIFKEAARHGVKACQMYLEATVKDLQGKGLKVDSVCLEGVPARAIIKYAQENTVDLIALATHGKGEVAWVMGSTAEKILSHATVPVLLLAGDGIQTALVERGILPGGLTGQGFKALTVRKLLIQGLWTGEA